MYQAGKTGPDISHVYLEGDRAGLEICTTSYLELGGVPGGEASHVHVLAAGEVGWRLGAPLVLAGGGLPGGEVHRQGGVGPRPLH